MSDIEYDPTRTGQGISLAVLIGLDAEVSPEIEENFRALIRSEVARAMWDLARTVARDEISKWEKRTVESMRSQGGYDERIR